MVSVLDPRIGYKSLLDDHINELELLEYIYTHKEELEAYYQDIYAGKASPEVPTLSPSLSISSSTPGSPEKEFHCLLLTTPALSF